MMKAFFKGLLGALAGFMLITALGVGVWALVCVFSLTGYAAVLVFLAAVGLLAGDVMICYKIGKG